MLEDEVNLSVGLGFLSVPVAEFWIHISWLAIQQVLFHELFGQVSFIREKQLIVLWNHPD